MTRYFILLFPIFISTLVVSSQIPENDPESLKAKGDNYLIESSYDSAVVYYSKAAAGFLREAQIKEYLYCKNQEAYTLGIQNKNQEALRICENIIEEYPDSLQAYRLDLYFFWKMALFNVRTGNFGVAYTYGVKTKETAESYSLFTGYMLNDVLDILSTSSRYLGLYELGLGYSFEKMKYNESQNDFLNLSHTYNNIALIYKRYHDREKALDYFMKCMELREKYAPQWTPYVTTNIGEMYLGFGQADSALNWFQKTVKILREQGVRENLLYSAVYSSISVIMSKNGESDSARIYIDKCLDIRSRYFGADDLHYTEFQLIKIEMLIADGEMAAAYEMLQSLDELYHNERISPQDRSGYHHVLAKYLDNCGKKSEALVAYQESIVSLSRDFEDMDIFSLPELDDYFYGKDELLRTLLKKTSLINELYIETGDSRYLRSVTDHYNFSLALIKMMIDDQGSMESVSNLYRDYSHLYEIAIKASVSMNDIDPGEWNFSNISSYMEASRMNHAKILYRLNQVINYGGIPDSVVNRKIELEKLVVSSGKDNIGSTVSPDKRESLVQELDRIQLLIKNEERNSDLVKTDNFDLLGEVQGKLGRKGMILQYYFGEEQLYLLSTTKMSNRLLILPWSSSEKENLDRYLKNLKDPAHDGNMTDLNNRVFHSLGLDSILTPGIDEIIVIPDRELYFVPFDALKDPGNDFLIKKYTIYTENSLFFMNAGNRRIKKGKVAMLGLAPFSDMGELSNTHVDAKRYGKVDLSPLPGSKDEVESIQKLTGGIIRTGISATEDFFIENAHNSEIIHISSHSFLDDTDPLFNSILFAKGEGVADGYLFTHEIYGMNLSADLVTLSACNTGIGRYLDGEGMISLATGFRSAGVRNIVMSLWNLPDDATSSVMIGFYKYLKKGEKKADALRMAKIDYLAGADQNTSSPYYWAASVLTGSNSATHLHNNYFILVAGILVILMFMVLTVRHLWQKGYLKKQG